MSSYAIGCHDLAETLTDPINTKERELNLWEKRIDALVKLFSDDKHSIISIHEFRFAIESPGTKAYTNHNYYERCTVAFRNLLIDKNVLSDLEITQKVREIENC